MMDEDNDGMKILSTAIVVIIGLLFLCMLFGSFYTIRSGERGIIQTFGKANPVPITEGLHLKWPFFQHVDRMSIQTEKYTADAEAASKDLQVLKASVVTNYRVDPGKVSELFITVGKDYEDVVIKPLEQECVKATTAKFTAEEAITMRESVREDIKKMLTDRLASRGIIVEDVSITNFDYSTSFNAAIEAKVVAEQEKLKAEKILERYRV